MLCAILNRHPELYVVNELPWHYYDFIDDSRPDRNRMVDMISRHQSVTQSEKSRLKEGTLPPLTVLQTAIQSRAEKLGKKTWGIKDPRLTQYYPQFKQEFPTARTIIILRDCRATAPSVVKMKEHVANLYYAARLWRDDMSMLLKYVRDADERTLVLRYEDFVVQPEEHVEAICKFLEVEFDSEMLDPEKKVPIVLHSGNINVIRPISADGVNRWQSELSSRQVALIEGVIGDLMVDAGYEPLTDSRYPGSIERLWYHLQQVVMTNYWWQKRSRLEELSRKFCKSLSKALGS